MGVHALRDPRVSGLHACTAMPANRTAWWRSRERAASPDPPVPAPSLLWTRGASNRHDQHWLPSKMRKGNFRPLLCHLLHRTRNDTGGADCSPDARVHASTAAAGHGAIPRLPARRRATGPRGRQLTALAPHRVGNSPARQIAAAGMVSLLSLCATENLFYCCAAPVLACMNRQFKMNRRWILATLGAADAKPSPFACRVALTHQFFARPRHRGRLSARSASRGVGWQGGRVPTVDALATGGCGGDF